MPDTRAVVSGVPFLHTPSVFSSSLPLRELCVSAVCLYVTPGTRIAVTHATTGDLVQNMHTKEGIGLKVEYVEPFVQAACSVLEQVSGGRAEPGPLGLLGTTFPAACMNIVTQVNGTLQGDVIYSMSSRTAQRLARNLVGAETYGFGRLVGSGLTQLGDLLAKRSGEQLSGVGLECEVSRPTVFQGLNVEFSASTPALSVPIETDAGRIDVNVAVRNDEQS